MLFEIDKYLSGYFTLNMPAPEGTTGDWHPTHDGIIPDIAWYGENKKNRNTLDCLGLYGLWDAGDWLRANGYTSLPPQCFAANHFRSVLDLVHNAACERAGRANRMISEEFFDKPFHKKIVLVKALQMAKYYDNDLIYGWVAHECSHSYAFDEEGLFDINELEQIAWGQNLQNQNRTPNLIL